MAIKLGKVEKERLTDDCLAILPSKDLETVTNAGSEDPRKLHK